MPIYQTDDCNTPNKSKKLQRKIQHTLNRT